MVSIEEFFSRFSINIGPFFRSLIIALILLIAFNILVSLIHKGLLKRAQRKKTISNITIFTRIIRYTGVTIILFIAFFSYVESWTGLGIAAGLFSAALGWSLQRPITGMAAWVMIVVKRPFQIGDRIIVAGVIGEVVDISLTHIYLNEIGGIAYSEEASGRVVMIPNSIMFEQNIINYTHVSDFTLDEIVFSITHDSNLDSAIELCVEAAKEIVKDYGSPEDRIPYVRTYFQPSGFNIHVRFFSPPKKRQEVSSLITQEINRQIKLRKDIKFAYPHTEVFVRRKNNEGEI